VRRFAALLAAAAGLAACGGDGDGRLTVSAASSLKVALPEYEPDARYSFAGSDDLAAQIRAGARPDVFAAANADLPAALHEEGLVDRPVTFAANRLVIAVPAESGAVRSVADLAQPGMRLAIGSPSVPVGSYTREVIARLGPKLERAVLANVRSSEPDAAGVVGKVAQRAVDAGFVYVTDVRASGGRLRAIELPPDLRPSVDYAAAVVRGTGSPERAAAFVDRLPGATALRDAGFEPPES
jgi:molybdate transport system substrate-binding protein